MDNLYALVAAFLMLNLLAGLYRIYAGPTPSDRLLAAQLLGTTGTAILLVLSAWLAVSPLVDAAIIFALLAAVTLITFVCRILAGLPPESEDHDDAAA